MTYDYKAKSKNVIIQNNYMLAKTVSMFEWENLPETIPYKELEKLQKQYEQLKAKDIKFFIDFNVTEYRVDNKLFQDKEFLWQDPDGYLLRFNN